MSSQRNWICDGVVRDGKDYPHSSGPHTPYENSGPDCVLCSLPKEAVVPVKGRGGRGAPAQGSGKLPILPLLATAGILGIGGGGFGLYQLLHVGQQPRINPVVPGLAATFVSQNAANASLISQGEKPLLTASSPQRIRMKQEAARVFAQENWEQAILQYQQLVEADRNDPETKIYLNNAKAKQAGRPLAIAVVVPIGQNPDSAREILRGVALYQTQFNQSPANPTQLLEVAIVNEAESSNAPALAEDLIRAANILGVLGHGVDSATQQALERYQQAKLAVLSPINTSVTATGSGLATLKILPPAQKASELLTTYLDNASKTLANYASQNHAPTRVALFYNSDSPYSQQLQDKVSTALQAVNANVVQAIDLAARPNLDAAAAIAQARQAGARILMLALSKNKVDTAIALAKANAEFATEPLVLLGGDELYNPTLLVEGGDAIAGIVLSVPWSFQSSDPFAKAAAENWKGRVSWRTATAYDATQALVTALKQAGDRPGTQARLQQGVQITGTATDFNLFNQVPLVKAVRGQAGPLGSQYQFDPIP